MPRPGRFPLQGRGTHVFLTSEPQPEARPPGGRKLRCSVFFALKERPLAPLGKEDSVSSIELKIRNSQSTRPVYPGRVMGAAEIEGSRAQVLLDGCFIASSLHAASEKRGQ